MKTAFKKIDITPQTPIRLSGFGKVRVSETVHDPIHARVFLFNQNNTEILWIQFDLCAVDQYLLNLIQKKTNIEEKTSNEKDPIIRVSIFFSTLLHFSLPPSSSLLPSPPFLLFLLLIT